MIAPGEQLCVACSGGADSLCLLVVLDELVREGALDATLSVCHLNHMLRGADSDGDESFVRQFCEERAIPFYAFREDVGALADAQKVGIEEAGRIARERMFARCISEHGADRIALAHHMNDQAETLLFRIARGTGLSGLAGIRPVQGKKIRPLLFASREEIEDALLSRDLSWREDASNAKLDYARNRVRNRLIPKMQEINDAAVPHLAALAELAADADDYIKEQAESCASRHLASEGDSVTVDAALLGEAPVIRQYVLRIAIGRMSAGLRDIGREQVEQLIDLLSGGSGRRLDLPGGLLAAMEYGKLRISRKQDAADPEACVRIDGEGIYAIGKERFRVSCFAYRGEAIPDEAYQKWLSCDIMSRDLVLRHPRQGDYFYLRADGGRKKLSDELIDRKLPKRARADLIVLAHGSEVFWIVGGRISARAMVTDETKRILKIEFLGEKGEDHE